MNAPASHQATKIAVNYNVGNRIVLPTSGSQEAISCSNQLSSVF